MMFLKLHRKEGDGVREWWMDPRGWTWSSEGGGGSFMCLPEAQPGPGRQPRGHATYVTEAPGEIEEIINHAAGRAGVWSLEGLRSHEAAIQRAIDRNVAAIRSERGDAS